MIEDEEMMSRENLAFIAATFPGVVLLFTIGLSRPDLLVEDGLVENLGAAGFSAASLLALSTALRRGAFLTPTERSILVGTSGLSLILFLSEISFGARIFDIQMPQMSGGGEFDGGHDIVIVLFRRLKDAGRTGILVAATGIGLLLATAVALLYLFRQKAQAIVKYVLSRAFEFRLAVAFGMLACAVTLDLITSYKASILEEVLEFSASGVLILAVSALLRQKGVLCFFGEMPEQGSQVRRAPAAGIDHYVGVGCHRANPPGRGNLAAQPIEDDHGNSLGAAKIGHQKGVYPFPELPRSGAYDETKTALTGDDPCSGWAEVKQSRPPWTIRPMNLASCRTMDAKNWKRLT